MGKGSARRPSTISAKATSPRRGGKATTTTKAGSQECFINLRRMLKDLKAAHRIEIRASFTGLSPGLLARELARDAEESSPTGVLR